MAKNIKLTCDLFKHQIFAIHGKMVRYTLTKRNYKHVVEGEAIANARGDITVTSKDDGKTWLFETQRWSECECKMDKNKTKVEFHYLRGYNDSTSGIPGDVNMVWCPATAIFEILRD